MSVQTSQQPAVDDQAAGALLLAAVDELAPLAQARAQAGEERGAVTPDVVEALGEAGLLRMLAPREWGGLDLGPLESLRVMEALSKVDMSAVWTVMVHNAHFKELYYLDKDAAEKVFAAGVPRIAGQGMPNGTAERVDGGYRVTGRWSYGSGLPSADHVSGVALIKEDGELRTTASGAPEALYFLTPVANVVPQGNWDVLGLRASGSVDYSVTDVFVPDELARADFYSAEFRWGGAAARLPLIGWLMWCHTAVEIGAGRRILDEIVTFAGRGSALRGRLSDSSTFRAELARAEAAYASARAWVYEVWTGIQATLDAGGSATRRQLTDSRAALLHLHEVDAANAAWVFRRSGGTGLRSGVIQRFTRDLLSAGQHVFLSLEGWEQCGKDYAGVAEGLNWSFFTLA